MRRIVIPYKPRAKQRELHKNRKRFSVDVVHRRFGKTVYAINGLLRNTLTNPLEQAQGCYIAPTQVQARRIAWDYLKKFTGVIPQTDANTQQLQLTFPNKSKIMLLSGASYESIRGMYLDDCVIDETADINPDAWESVIRPALADRKGGCAFIGTPKGMDNLLADLYHKVPDMGEDWSRSLLTYQDTGVLDPDEVEAMRREMSPGKFDQELMCSFSAALEGAYWSKEMDEMEQEGRIKSIKWDKNLPVHTSWDLGWRNSTIVWYWQQIAGEVRALRCEPYQFTPLPDIIQKVKAHPYNYGFHIGPHDIDKHELGSGQTVAEIGRRLGLPFKKCPSISKMDGISAVQSALPRVWMDRDLCKPGIIACRQYRSEYDPFKRVYSHEPLHDWCSDYADAVRMYFVFMKGGNRQRNQGQLDYSDSNRAAV